MRALSPNARTFSLTRHDRGYFQDAVDGVESGTLYFYSLDGKEELPDPASRFQPQGVHGPSQVVDSSFRWGDADWRGLPIEKYLIYEIHVGAFTAEGTFDAAIPQLAELKALGVTAIELMPVAQFPGARNWGYDVAFPFAVQNSYGGPAGLRRLVNACHRAGLAVVLDVVYNHLGPEGNYLGRFAPYFSDRCRTPWGPAINFDGAYSDEVRRFFLQNAIYWLTEFHVDSLRLDAVHAVVDSSPVEFLSEMASTVHDLGRRLNRHIYLFAESDRNDARLVTPPASGGLGLDAVWNDDFHHALHTLLTDERAGYYNDFHGFADLAKALTGGFVYEGQYSEYRKRRHGSPSHSLPGSSFVVFAQNHDQVGNRMMGERLSALVPLEKLKLAAASILLSPFIPLLFMGEEYGESSPFLYFVSYLDQQVAEAARQGRAAEFSSFGWPGHPPDPQDQTTFLRSRIDRDLRQRGWHSELYGFYRELIRLRKEVAALGRLDKEAMELTVWEEEKALAIRRWADADEALIIFNFGDAEASLTVRLPPGRWQKQLDSGASRPSGEGPLLPDAIDSSGQVRLPLRPLTLVAYSRDKP